MMRNKLFHSMLVLLTVAGMVACGRGGAPQAAASNAPDLSGDVKLVGSTSFTDEWGWYNIAGEIVNDSNQSMTSIELGVEVRDAAGVSLLKDDAGTPVERISMSPLLDTLAPGEYAPFSYTFDPAGSVPSSFDVTVQAATSAETHRPDLSVTSTDLVNDGSGTLYLSGELVNQSDKWVQIHGLAGAGVDASQQVLTADWSATYIAMLAPAGDATGRDRTPFSIQFTVPGSVELTPKVFVDADLADAPADPGLQLHVTNSYYDSFNSYHIVGTVTNASSDRLHAVIVGGLYADDGTALDATWSFVPFIVEPGAEIPFDVASFNNVNWNAKQASRVTRYTLQIDPSGTYTSEGEVVNLTTANDQIRQDGATWTFNGDVLNSSGRALSGETVIVAIYNAQGILASTASAYISPAGDSISGGEVNTYEVNLFIDPTADPTGYTYRTFVQGDVK